MILFFPFIVPVKAFKGVKDMIHVTSSEDLFYLRLKVCQTMFRSQFQEKIAASCKKVIKTKSKTFFKKLILIESKCVHAKYLLGIVK